MSRASRAASLAVARKVPGTQRTTLAPAMSNSRATVMGSPRGESDVVTRDNAGSAMTSTPVDGRRAFAGERLRSPKRNTLANRKHGGGSMHWRPGVSAAYGMRGMHGR